MIKVKKYKSVGKHDKEKHIYIHEFVCKLCNKNSKKMLPDKTTFINRVCNLHPRKNEWLWKPVCFINVLTEKKESANSIVEFCNNHPELGKNARYHFTPVMKKERIHYKGWTLPETYSLVDISKIKIVEQILIKQSLFER